MKKLLFIISLGIIVIIGVVMKDKIMGYFKDVKRTTNSKEVKIIMDANPTPESVANLLADAGVIKNKKDVTEYYQKKGNPKISGGKYVIKSGELLENLLDGMIEVDGHGRDEVKVKVLFNNYWDIHDMAATIQKCIQADSASIVDYLTSDSVLKSLNCKEEQLLAFFIPATYEMYYDSDAADFLNFMLEQYNKFWTDERLLKMKKLNLKSKMDVITLASIVYGEQGEDNGEWETITGLYLNRLNKGILLQSDPTVKFCWGEQGKDINRVLNKHLEKDCPYNTYLHAGLPPGPISFVPFQVVDAVLNSKPNEYIYMCAKPGGESHLFTDNLSVHSRNAAAYQRWLNERDIR